MSWGRMRREVLADVRQLQGMLENHARAGLPAADLQVIRRGKALEYFSRHYGKVYVDEGRPISVKDALVGINQLIDEDAEQGHEPPPVNRRADHAAVPANLDGKAELARDQIAKVAEGLGHHARRVRAAADGARRRTRSSTSPIRWHLPTNGRASIAGV